MCRQKGKNIGGRQSLNEQNYVGSVYLFRRRNRQKLSIRINAINLALSGGIPNRYERYKKLYK